jgi:pimeloyl-ACP methyl ester carboxylesterase
LTPPSAARLMRAASKGKAAMPEIKHSLIETNGIGMHIAEKGSGPLVLLCHGFPESWYSWRHQLDALAKAGYRAVAPDMRGYGQTERPEAIDQYTLFHLVGDMVGVLDALGVETAVIAGHDWGAPVAWHAALLRPDRFPAVIGLSVPYRPRGPVRPTTVMPQTEDAVFYQLHFQTPGVADAELAHDVRATLQGVLIKLSGDAPPGIPSFSMVPRTASQRARSAPLPPLPGWLTQDDIDFYTESFARTGFTGGLNWYRNIDRNWELFAPFAGARVTVPALFVAGDRDLVLAFPGAQQLVANLQAFVPQLRQTIILPGCGHWTQQERASEVNAAMLDFLRGL